MGPYNFCTAFSSRTPVTPHPPNTKFMVFFPSLRSNHSVDAVYVQKVDPASLQNIKVLTIVKVH
jgi:hypothetical protein